MNTQEVFSVYPPVRDAQNQLEAQSKQLEDQLVKMNEEGQKKLDEFNQMVKQKGGEQNAASDPIMQDKANEIQALQQRIQLFQQTAREQIQKKQETLMMPIQKAIKDAIDAVSAEGGYTYVVDEQALLFKSSKATNLTPAVRKKLNIPANAQPINFDASVAK